MANFINAVEAAKITKTAWDKDLAKAAEKIEEEAKKGEVQAYIHLPWNNTYCVNILREAGYKVTDVEVNLTLECSSCWVSWEAQTEN